MLVILMMMVMPVCDGGYADTRADDVDYCCGAGRSDYYGDADDDPLNAFDDAYSDLFYYLGL